MAATRDWADAYLAQARADLAGARAMAGASPSTFAMVIQMVFEKYAKAALLRQNAVSLDWAKTSHGSASRMLLVLHRQRELLEPLGGTIVWEDVLSTIYNLERAHPALAPKDGPQLEYPWEDVHGDVRWPARDLAIARAMGDASNMLGPRVLQFAEQLGRHFDSMFA